MAHTCWVRQGLRVGGGPPVAGADLSRGRPVVARRAVLLLAAATGLVLRARGVVSGTGRRAAVAGVDRDGWGDARFGTIAT